MKKDAIQQCFTMARAHLALGNPQAYAQIISAAHRSARTEKAQSAIVMEIYDDGMDNSFVMTNGCLVAAVERQARHA